MTIETGEAPVEARLRDELARADAALATIGPVLGHLLAEHDHSLLSDEIVSRVRGMLGDIARQLASSMAEAAETADPALLSEPDAASLTARLSHDEALIRHCHALALEGQLALRLERRAGIDPVLSPLLQALIASDDATTAGIAMATLAAQARFVQQQRRMELPLGELPAELFDRVLSSAAEWRAAQQGAQGSARTVGTWRRNYDEGASRLALLARLVEGMGAASVAALSLGHAGAAMFLTALAAASRLDRGLAIAATNESQQARLALALRAAGLKPREVEEQLLVVHADVALPEGFEALRAERAAEILAFTYPGPRG